MATFNKYVRLDPNILLEWVYDDENITQETYTVINNLPITRKGFVSSLAGNFNVYENTTFEVDKLLKKYAKVDTTQFNFLKKQDFSTAPIVYDKLKLHMPTNFSFNRDNILNATSYRGFYIHVYTYDNTSKKIVDMASLIYDDEDSTNSQYINLNIQTLTYDNKFWGKYIEFSIPSVNTVANQVDSSTKPLSNTINNNLTNGVGLSKISPIFVQFAYISATEVNFGVKYYYLSDIYTVSISQTPEYQTLGVSIEESSQGDFFEIYGTYNGTNQNIDDFITDLIQKGKRPSLQYTVYLYEENVLSSQQTYLITDNFSQKLLYRPVIQFANTTAAIDVEMDIIDAVDESKITRVASLGLTNNIFKYGKHLTKIDITGAYKPKIYNRKQQSGPVSISNSQTFMVNKVNYPMLVDRVKILAGSSASVSTDYKSMGQLEIILTPFSNVIKFMIASDVNSDGSVTPYNLSKLLLNSTLMLTFKSDNLLLEKNIFYETDQNDYTNGIVVFKLDESDLYTVQNIAKNNHNFYITLKSTNTTTRSLFYSGKFALFNEVKFVNTNNLSNATGVDTANIDTSSVLNATQLAGSSGSNTIKNRNALIFLDLNANVTDFENYLSAQKANIYLKEAGGNSSCGAYVYLLLSLSPAFVESLKVQTGVKKIVPLDFDLGKNLPTVTNNLNDIKNQIAQFNCAAADKAQQQQPLPIPPPNA